MQNKEIEFKLDFLKRDGTVFLTDIEDIREYIDQLENKVKELECDNHNRENKIIEQETFLQMSVEVIKNSLLKQIIRDRIELYKQLEIESFNRDSIQADEYRAGSVILN